METKLIYDTKTKNRLTYRKAKKELFELLESVINHLAAVQSLYIMIKIS